MPGADRYALAQKMLANEDAADSWGRVAWLGREREKPTLAQNTGTIYSGRKPDLGEFRRRRGELINGGKVGIDIAVIGGEELHVFRLLKTRS